MRRIYLYLIPCLFLTINAAAAPLGLSGLSVSIGGGGLTDGYLAGEYDFEISKYVCVGPEFGLGFGDGMAVYAGGAGRLYIIPDEHDVFQPQITFGAGLGHRFDDDETLPDEELTGAYIVAAPGCDFDIPKSPVSPYLGLGGFFFFGDESDAAFIAEIGVRIDL
ncbi:MAG: hypothetical protein GY771_10980 [bacterium]|nr:hypothetical protein [bacterium]